MSQGVIYLDEIKFNLPDETLGVNTIRYEWNGPLCVSESVTLKKILLNFGMNLSTSSEGNVQSTYTKLKVISFLIEYMGLWTLLFFGLK